MTDDKKDKVEWEPDTELNRRIWDCVLRHMIAVQFAFREEKHENVNPASMSLGLLLWSVRIAKKSKQISRNEWIAQCANVWDSNLADLPDDEIKQRILMQDLEAQKPLGEA